MKSDVGLLMTISAERGDPVRSGPARRGLPIDSAVSGFSQSTPPRIRQHPAMPTGGSRTKRSTRASTLVHRRSERPDRSELSRPSLAVR